MNRMSHIEALASYAEYAATTKSPVTGFRHYGLSDFDRALARKSEPRSEYEAYQALAYPVDRSNPE